MRSSVTERGGGGVRLGSACYTDSEPAMKKLFNCYAIREKRSTVVEREKKRR